MVLKINVSIQLLQPLLSGAYLSNPTLRFAHLYGVLDAHGYFEV